MSFRLKSVTTRFSRWIDAHAASLFQFRQILGRILLKLGNAALAAEFQRLSLIYIFEGLAHFAEGFAGDDALFRGSGGLSGYGLRGLA